MPKSSGRFDYVKYDEKATKQQAQFKKVFESLENAIEQELGHGRAKALCLTALEETYMWIGKQIRDDQIFRNETTELLEERNNS